MHDLFSSIRHAGRRAVRNPTTSAIAVLTMALAMALATATFAILDGILIRGLPFEDPNRLVHLERNHLERNLSSLEVSQHDFEDWRAQQSSFGGLGAFSTGTVYLAGERLPERYAGARISANTLELLGIVPVLGRGFTSTDESDGAPLAILIGHHVWQQRYGGAPDVLGTETRINGTPAKVAGVLPAGFRFPVRQDVWLPLRLETHRLARGEGATLEVFGRIRSGHNLTR